MEEYDNTFSEKRYFLIRYALPICISILSLIVFFLSQFKINGKTIIELVYKFYMQ